MSSLASCRARSKFQECGVHGEQQRARQVPADSKAAGTRPPAVAGLFYPRDPVRLQEDVLELLGGVALASKVMPKALIAPHAGYVYSGRVAGAADAMLRRPALLRGSRTLVEMPSPPIGRPDMTLQNDLQLSLLS